uniref:Glyco_transf_20 n=1 Tax=Parascaris equorum TaxID=6256 RepID=A0A914RK71_PAREQ
MAYKEYFTKYRDRIGKDVLYQLYLGLPRADLVASYLAMDIGVVTPKKDGMNLVAKEMLVCNPHAGLILSTGAGSEIQFSTAGFYNEENGDQCYKRVADLYDIQ